MNGTNDNFEIGPYLCAVNNNNNSDYIVLYYMYSVQFQIRLYSSSTYINYYDK